jgi:rhamnosyltransferase
MNIAAVVIVYHPDQNLIQRILTYLPFVNKLFVFDNSEGATNDWLKEELSGLNNTLYIADGENKGISVRLNKAAELSIQDGFEWLLTMDQDSYFPEGSIPSYFACIAQFHQKNNAAMFGIQSLTENKSDSSCHPEEVPHLITSGSALNLSLFKNIGPFDEALFIDKVDHEYCLRARSKNFKIVRFNNIFMHHNLGTITYGRSLKNFKLTPRTLHSPVRMYYILRNYFYLKEKYKGKFLEEFKELKKEIWNRSKNNFLYGGKKLQLIGYLFKAYSDFKKGKTGKL